MAGVNAAEKLLQGPFDKLTVNEPSELGSTAENHSDKRKQNDNMLSTRTISHEMSKKRVTQLSSDTLLDISRAISIISTDSRKESHAALDNYGDHPEISLDQQVARDRIQRLHDAFVSSGEQGLSMDEFRSTMRQALAEESTRKIEDDELDKVPAIMLFLSNMHEHYQPPPLRNIYLIYKN